MNGVLVSGALHRQVNWF